MREKKFEIQNHIWYMLWNYKVYPKNQSHQL